ncbi:hypothetical protein Sste5346_005128 [Sporothrix stenoceras]|uniref:Uncharacterized protein n=1 Tax=Sporothrix stenoceras TaxID=5173 RepID=A0ABR3Z4U8_9PEZI
MAHRGKRGGRSHKKGKNKNANADRAASAPAEMQTNSVASDHQETLVNPVVSLPQQAQGSGDNGGEGPFSPPFVSILGGPIYASPVQMSDAQLARFPRGNDLNKDVSDLELTEPSSVDGVEKKNKGKGKATCGDSSDELATDPSSSDDDDDDDDDIPPSKSDKAKGKQLAYKTSANGQSSKSKAAKGKGKENCPPVTPLQQVDSDFGGGSSSTAVDDVWHPGHRTPPSPSPISIPYVISNGIAQENVFGPAAPCPRPRPRPHVQHQHRQQCGLPRLRHGPVRRVKYSTAMTAMPCAQTAQFEYAGPSSSSQNVNDNIHGSTSFNLPAGLEIDADGNLLIILVNGSMDNELARFLVDAHMFSTTSLVWMGVLKQWRAQVIPLQPQDMGPHTSVMHDFAQYGPAAQTMVRREIRQMLGRSVSNDIVKRITHSILYGERSYSGFPFPVVDSFCQRKRNDRIFCCNQGADNGFGFCDTHEFKQLLGTITIDIAPWLEQGVSPWDAIIAFLTTLTAARGNIDQIGELPFPLTISGTAALLDLTVRTQIGIPMRFVTDNRVATFGITERTSLYHVGPFAYHMHRHLVHFNQMGQHLRILYRETLLTHMFLHEASLSKMLIYWFTRERHAFELTLRHVAWQTYVTVADNNDDDINGNGKKIRLHHVHLTLMNTAHGPGNAEDGTNSLTVPPTHLMADFIATTRRGFLHQLYRIANASFAQLWYHVQSSPHGIATCPKSNIKMKRTANCTIPQFKCKSSTASDVDKAKCDHAHLNALIQQMHTLTTPGFVPIPFADSVGNAHPNANPPHFVLNTEVNKWLGTPYSLIGYIGETIRKVHEHAIAHLWEVLDMPWDARMHSDCTGSLESAVEDCEQFLYETRQFPESALYPFTVMSQQMEDQMRTNHTLLFNVRLSLFDKDDAVVPPGEDQRTATEVQNLLNRVFLGMIEEMGLRVVENEVESSDESASASDETDNGE